MRTEEKLSVAGQTFAWIKKYPFLITALKKDLINFSSLARKIQKDLNIKNFDAILVAIRRYQNQIKWIENDKRIIEVLKQSQLNIKTGITVYSIKQDELKILDNIDYYHLVQNGDKTEVVTDSELDSETLWKNAVEVKVTSTDIETIPGVIAYITSALAERGINILKMYSFHGNIGYFVFEKKDLPSVIEVFESIGIK